MNIYDILNRARSLKEEYRLDSVTPERLGALHEDTLKYINEYQLLASSPSLHKIYASVSAMQSDNSPKSDLTGKPLKPGQLVVIVPANQSDATAGDVYRYDGPSGNTSAWTFVSKIGGVPADAELSATSTNPPQNKVVTEKLTELESEMFSNIILSIHDGSNIIKQSLTKGKFYTVYNKTTDTLTFRTCNADGTVIQDISTSSGIQSGKHIFFIAEDNTDYIRIYSSVDGVVEITPLEKIITTFTIHSFDNNKKEVIKDSDWTANGSYIDVQGALRTNPFLFIDGAITNTMLITVYSWSENEFLGKGVFENTKYIALALKKGEKLFYSVDTDCRKEDEIEVVPNITIDDSVGFAIFYNGNSCTKPIKYSSKIKLNENPTQIHYYHGMIYLGFSTSTFDNIVWRTDNHNLIPTHIVYSFNRVVDSVKILDESAISISIGNDTYNSVNNVIPIPEATNTKGGYMSAEDKEKLDSLNPEIVITGSGVSKNASAFGFLPNKTAEENKIALENAISSLGGNGTVLIDYPGVYPLNGTILIPSNTTLLFGSGVKISQPETNKAILFANEGAATQTYDENIKIIGLNLISNGVRVTSGNTILIGLVGHVSFNYVKNLVIDNYVIEDMGESGYGLQINAFENVTVKNCTIRGKKDGIHFGRGIYFTVRDCIFECYDDAIALNGVDFTESNPEVGWIKHGLIENIKDLSSSNHSAAGHFCRMMGGVWKNWESGAEVSNSHTVVVNDNGVKKLYRVSVYGYSPYDELKLISTTRPSLDTVGSHQQLDTQTVKDKNGNDKTVSIRWNLIMKGEDVGYDGGVEDVTFRNIYMQKSRTFNIQYYFDRGIWLRAAVSGALGTSVMRDLVFDHIILDQSFNKQYLFDNNCPTQNIKVTNSVIRNVNSIFKCSNILGEIPDIPYPDTNILLSNNTYCRNNGMEIVNNADTNRTINLKMVGSFHEGNNFSVYSTNTNVISKDI